MTVLNRLLLDGGMGISDDVANVMNEWMDIEQMDGR